MLLCSALKCISAWVARAALLTSGAMSTKPDTKTLAMAFVGLFLLTALPHVSSPSAMLLGFAFSFLFGNPLPVLTARASRVLLKLSVVGLGFGVNIVDVIALGQSSLLITVLLIAATVGVGSLLGRVLGVSGNTGLLISFGTAICGGSAIAAMAPVVKARNDEVAVSLATVFSLNAVALILFPLVGRLLQLSQHEFGLWSALAIHDTSSVVGASATFGAVALTVGTTTKLVRALWIAPCTLVAGMLNRSGKGVGIPLFIVGFVVAAFVSSWLPNYQVAWDNIYTVARQALVMTLFLIGAGLTKELLKQVGMRPLLFGALLWVVVSVSTLTLIVSGSLG